MIPAYARREFLRQGIRAVLTSEYPNVEVIVIDDGSPNDVTAGLDQEFDGDPVRFIRQANAGTARARNHGCALARGRYIMLLDDDDLVVRGSLSWRVGVLEAQPHLCAVGGRCLFMRGDAPIGEEPQRWTGELDAWDLLVFNRFYSTGQVLFRREAFTQVEGCRPDLLGSDEWDLWIQLAQVGPILMDQRFALTYRYHEGNFSSNVVMMVQGALAVADRWIARTCDRHVDAARFLTQQFIAAIYAEPIERAAAHAWRRGDRAGAVRLTAFGAQLRANTVTNRLHLKWSLLRHHGQWRLPYDDLLTLGRGCTACAALRWDALPHAPRHAA